MKQVLKNLFEERKTDQRTVTITEVISADEYIVKDTLNRKYRVKSDRKWRTGNIVVIQNNWILGTGKLNKTVNTYSV